MRRKVDPKAAVGSPPMDDMRDETATALRVARARLRQTERGQPVEVERVFVRALRAVHGFTALNVCGTRSRTVSTLTPPYIDLGVS